MPAQPTLERLTTAFAEMAALLPEESALHQALIEIVALLMQAQAGTPLHQVLSKLQTMIDKSASYLFSLNPEEQAANAEVWHVFCMAYAVLRQVARPEMERKSA